MESPVADAVVTRFAKALLFDVSPLDLLALGTVATVLLGVAVATSYLRARRGDAGGSDGGAPI